MKSKKVKGLGVFSMNSQGIKIDMGVNKNKEVVGIDYVKKQLPIEKDSMWFENTTSEVR